MLSRKIYAILRTLTDQKPSHVGQISFIDIRMAIARRPNDRVQLRFRLARNAVARDPHVRIIESSNFSGDFTQKHVAGNRKQIRFSLVLNRH